MNFNKFNNNTLSNTTNHYIYTNNTLDLYTINNKPIEYLNDSYLKYENTNQKFYISKVPNNNFNITTVNNQTLNFNSNHLLTDCSIKDNNITIFQFKNNTPLPNDSNKIHYTYINNNLKFINESQVYPQNTLNESSSNCFNIFIQPYYTYTNSSMIILL